MSDRATVIVTQRERFGMTEESLESLLENTPGVPIVYVDGRSPRRVAAYLDGKARQGVLQLIRKRGT